MEYGRDVLGLKEVIGMTLEGNAASDNVLLKLGFVEAEDSPIDEDGLKLKLFVLRL